MYLVSYFDGTTKVHEYMSHADYVQLKANAKQHNIRITETQVLNVNAR